MQNILTQLYAGDLAPKEQHRPKLEQYQKLYTQQSRCYDNFVQALEQLQPPLVQQFHDILDTQLHPLPLEQEQAFIDGFCMGAKIIMEVFQNDDAPKRPGENGL